MPVSLRIAVANERPNVTIPLGRFVLCSRDGRGYGSQPATVYFAVVAAAGSSCAWTP